MELLALRKEIFIIINNIKNNYNKEQPWLNPPEAFERDSFAKQQGRRADQSGTVRNLKLSDLGSVTQCEILFASSLLGVSLEMGTIKKDSAYRGKSGTYFHNELERLMPEGIITPKRNPKKCYVRLPSIGDFTNKEYTNKWYSGIVGEFDSFAPKWNTGLEFKSFISGQKTPTELPERALIQGALYAYGLNLKGKKIDYWSWLYLPQDLTSLNPKDISTYNVFFESYDNLEKIALEVLEKAKYISTKAELVSGDFNKLKNSLTCYNPLCDFCKMPW